jgi:quinol monooxygenase YgiN
MITVKVTYTVKPEFVAQNKQNINAFIADFQEMNNSDFRYNVYINSDGATFVHISHYKNKEIQQQLLNTASFLEFQKQRDYSGINDSHKVEVMEFLNASHEIF